MTKHLSNILKIWITFGFPVIATLFVSLQAAAAFPRPRSIGSLFNTHSIGLAAGWIQAQQTDLNEHLTSVSTSSGPFGPGFEYDLNYQYRFFDSMLAFHLRPAYFSQKASGGGYDYDLVGYTIFPLLKMYVIESRETHLYLIGGIGYGSLRGSISQPTGKLQFEGNAVGTMAGLGAEYCSLEGNCLMFETAYRNLPIGKSIVQNYSGTFGGFTQYTTDRELEISGIDVETNMSGFIVRLGYQYWMNW